MTDASTLWKLAQLGQIGSSRLRFDDDLSDRLNYQFSGFWLLLFVGLIGIRQYGGKSIQCWMPQEFSRSWEEYVESYCWVSQTHFTPLVSTSSVEPASFLVPVTRTPVGSSSICASSTSSSRINYYQWAPIFMACQMLCFYVPCLTWRLFHSRSVFQLRRCVQMGLDANLLQAGVLRKQVQAMARFLETCLARQRDLLVSRNNHRNRSSWRQRLYASIVLCQWSCVRPDHYLACLYLIVKAMYILNIVAQLYVMEKFVGSANGLVPFGLRVLWDLWRGETWSETGHFPRVTFCCVQAKKFEENHKYTVQCVLPLNMFLEKIYIFLWLWFLLVGVVNVCSLISWFVNLVVTKHRIHFVTKYISVSNSTAQPYILDNKDTWERFVNHYLRVDGVFVLQMIALNCGDVVVGDLIQDLWRDYAYRKFLSPVGCSVNTPGRTMLLAVDDGTRRNRKIIRSSSFSTNKDDSVV